MAEDRYRQDYPQQSRPEDRSSHAHHRPLSQPTDSSQRPSEEHRPGMATSVTLPSIHDAAARYGPPPPGAPQHGYAYDPRHPSPNTTNGWPAPAQPPYLPPLQPQGGDPRSPGYRPPHEQYPGNRQPPHYPHEGQYPPPDYYYRGPPPQGGPPNGYAYDGRPLPAYGPEYAQQQGGPQMAQAAPRQRTSIACKYCRKRKIRCSGYQSAPGGKCQNCARMNQECVFQPVSSSSSTAFIPVSAVPGGVPPGTPLYGAYGQPLAPQPPHPYQSGHPQQPPPANYYPPQPVHGQHPPPQGQPVQHPTHSPTESSYSYNSARGDEGSQGSRRRRRPSEDQEEGYRLPPPRVGAAEEDPRRRSPAEFSNNSSPGALGYPPYARNSPRNPALPQLSAPGVQGSPQAGNHTLPMHDGRPSHDGRPPHDGRSPVIKNESRHESSGASTPSRPSQSANHTPTNQSAYPSQSQQSSSVMSLSNVVDREPKNDIDKGMIDRLNRPRDNKPPPSSGLR